jgi:hypothetical protein
MLKQKIKDLEQDDKYLLEQNKILLKNNEGLVKQIKNLAAKHKEELTQKNQELAARSKFKVENMSNIKAELFDSFKENIKELKETITNSYIMTGRSGIEEKLKQLESYLVESEQNRKQEPAPQASSSSTRPLNSPGRERRKLRKKKKRSFLAFLLLKEI